MALHPRPITPPNLLNFVARVLVSTITVVLVLHGTARADPTFVSSGDTTYESIYQASQRADCVIVGNWCDAVFSSSDEDSLVFREASFRQADGTTHSRGVFFKRSVTNKSVGAFTIPGWFQFDLANGVLDRWGNYHDLHVRFDNMSGFWNRWLAEDSFGSAATTVYENLLFIHGAGDCLDAQAFQSALFDENWNAFTGADGRLAKLQRKDSLAHSYDITLWIDDGELDYNLYLEDIDIPNCIKPVTDASYDSSTDGYYGHWAEGINRIGSYGDVYVTSNTSIQFNDYRIMGSRESSNGPESSLISLGTITNSKDTSMGIKWAGCRCSTVIFKNHSYDIVTKAGVGGSCAQVAGADPTQEPIDLAQTSIDEAPFVTQTTLQSVPKNDYVVTITPEDGYVIDEVTCDGADVEVTTPEGFSVSLPAVSADHVVTATFKPAEKGLTIRKKSSLEALTAGNTCYALEGAVYNVFADSECTESVATLTTHASGVTETVSLAAGTYYLKETKASPGYVLDEEVRELTVALGSDNTFTVPEVPQVATVSAIVQKVDAELGTPAPQGGASLAGAEFTVNFYAGSYAQDSLPAEPTRRWVLKTEGNGTACLDDAHLVDGDELYVDSSGNAVLPLGTITITETKAPEGYQIPADDMTVYQQICSAGEGAQAAVFATSTQDVPTVREPVDRGCLKVKKVDADDNEGLAGAVFDIVNLNPNPVVVGGKTFDTQQVCLSITSDKNGIAATEADALPFGTYEVREAQAPQGYLADTTWTKRVSISSAGSVVDLSDEPLSNRPQSASVKLVGQKHFEGASQGLSLKANMFSFELVGPDGTVLQTKKNNAKGVISFDALSFGPQDAGKTFTYTIREVAGSDERIIYDTHVEEVVVKVSLQDDGTLAAVAQADDDGITFSNTTVPALSLPRTGREGLGDGALATVLAILTGMLAVASQSRKA